MAPRKQTDERHDTPQGEVQVEKPGTSATPTEPVNPPEPEEPMPQPEPQVGSVNPPDSETPQQGVDNRTREGRQVPVNPE